MGYLVLLSAKPKTKWLNMKASIFSRFSVSPIPDESFTAICNNCRELLGLHCDRPVILIGFRGIHNEEFHNNIMAVPLKSPTATKSHSLLCLFLHWNFLPYSGVIVGVEIARICKFQGTSYYFM